LKNLETEQFLSFMMKKDKNLERKKIYDSKLFNRVITKLNSIFRNDKKYLNLRKYRNKNKKKFGISSLFFNEIPRKKVVIEQFYMKKTPF